MINIALVGDILMTRPLPEKGYDGLQDIINLIGEHEVKFANLETTVHRNEGYPSAFPGGTWVMADPICLNDIKKLGFNLLNTANNHSMDYSHNGLIATQSYLREHGLAFAGTGENLAEATKARFIDCSQGRVSLIGATSSFHDADAAGNQGVDMRGRPGVNPLRHKSIYEVTEENYSILQQIANETGINDYHNQAIKEGYLLPKDNFNFSHLEFVKSKNNALRTYPLEKDLNRIKRSIIDARKQSDCVIVSIHSHQFSDGEKTNPAEFIQLFSKECIDAGATIVVGHGPHVVRGIEAYNHGVIFYGLGNFIFQNETVTHLPAEFYEKYQLDWDSGVGAAMDKRSHNGNKGLSIQEDAWESVIVSLSVDNQQIDIKLYPVELGYDLPRSQKGVPRLSYSNKVLETIQTLSAKFNTDISVIDNVGQLTINCIQ